MGAHYINVAPRYTPGSPASVHMDIAEKVAIEEKDAHDFVLKGYEGAERAEKAKEPDALKLIVFEMVEVSKGWWVHDWITHEMHWWPFLAECPRCGTKKVVCKRGVINEHGCPFKFAGYVGRPANEEEMYKHGRRFWKTLPIDNSSGR